MTTPSEALRQALPYIEAASTQYYDGVGGQQKRETAMALLERARAALAAQPAAEPDERAAFEVWALEQKKAYRCDKGMLWFYASGAAHDYWAGWQARAMKAKP